MYTLFVSPNLKVVLGKLKAVFLLVSMQVHGDAVHDIDTVNKLSYGDVSQLQHKLMTHVSAIMNQGNLVLL